MFKRMTIAATLAIVAGLAGCGGNGSAGSPPTSGSVSFPQFVSTDVTTETCDKMQPTEVDPIDFTFDANQDTASPFDVTSLNPGCSS